MTTGAPIARSPERASVAIAEEIESNLHPLGEAMTEKLRKRTMLMLTAVSIPFAMALTLLYWLLWPVEVISIQRVSVSQATIVPGDDVIYDMEYCKPAGELQGAIRQSLVGVRDSTGTAVQYAVSGRANGYLESGCHLATLGFVLPQVPAGTYHLELGVDHGPSPLRTFVPANGKSKAFRVLRPAPPDNIEALLRENSALIRANEDLSKANARLLKDLAKALVK